MRIRHLSNISYSVPAGSGFIASALLAVMGLLKGVFRRAGGAPRTRGLEASDADAIGIHSVHGRVDSCGLPGSRRPHSDNGSSR